MLISLKSSDYTGHAAQKGNISQNVLLVCGWKQPEKEAETSGHSCNGMVEKASLRET